MTMDILDKCYIISKISQRENFSEEYFSSQVVDKYVQLIDFHEIFENFLCTIFISFRSSLTPSGVVHSTSN